jgi:hypothetical protein
MVGVKFGKRIREIATTLNFSGQYVLSFSDVMRQGEIMESRGDIVNLGMNTVTRFGRAVRMDYDISWMRSLTSLSRAGVRYTPIDIARQEVRLTLSLSEKLNLNIAGEHYFNSATKGSGRNALFADARLSYNTARVEYIVEARNLFGSASYNTASYGEAMSSAYSYRIRPRSIMLKLRFSIK